MHEVLVNRLGGLSLPRKSVVRLTDRPDMTLDVYRGRKTTIQRTLPSQPLESYSDNPRGDWIDVFSIITAMNKDVYSHTILFIIVAYVQVHKDLNI